MKIMRTILLIGFAVVIAALPAMSQTTHDVTVTNFSFLPKDLSIKVGDMVRWANQLGTHNVVADDGSFTSGALAGGIWSYEKVFTAEGTFPYYCALHGGPGGIGMSGTITVTPVSTGITARSAQPEEFVVDQNYPNPFNPSTKIRFDIPRAGNVTVRVYDILGQEVATLLDSRETAGHHEVEFQAGNLPSGIYLYKVEAGNLSQMKKMILLK